MPFQISIAKDAVQLFQTDATTDTLPRIIAIFPELDTRFPESEGFNLTVHRMASDYPGIDRARFRQAGKTKNTRQVLELFFNQQEFQNFQATRRIEFPEDVIHEEGFDDLGCYTNIVHVFVYVDNYYLLEREGGEYKYLIPTYGDPQSNDLQHLERELFLCYLADGDVY